MAFIIVKFDSKLPHIYIYATPQNAYIHTVNRASAGRSSIRHWRKDLTNDEKKCNSFRQFDKSIKSTYFKIIYR